MTLQWIGKAGRRMFITVSVRRRKIRLHGRLAMLARKFRNNDDGATAVEFALVSVPFLGLLFAIFETAFIFFATQGVEAAVNEAARAVMTGQVQYDAGITSAAQFKDQIICNPVAPRKRILPNFINCDKLILDVRRSNNFSSANMSRDFISNPGETFCTGSGGDIVVIRMVYPMPVYLSILGMTSMSSGSISVNTSGQTKFGGGMKHMLMGTAAFRNEPFPDGARAIPSC